MSPERDAFHRSGLDREATVFVAGGDTLVGRAILRRLESQGFAGIAGAPPNEPDLADRAQVEEFFGSVRPQYVYVAAGKSAGIEANQKYPAELMLDNLLATCHVIDCAWRHGARKLLYLASSCCYPKKAPQPMRVESLLTGPLEPTNEPYAVAKLAGLKLCTSYRRQYGARFISAIPANVFGPGDHFDPLDSHVIPSLICKLHNAKVSCSPAVELWGTGEPRREFIFADDLADACLFVMERYDADSPINLGGGLDLSIREVAQAVQEIVQYTGELRFDTSKPDGMPLKSLDSSGLTGLGWRPRTSFFYALAATYDWFLEHEAREKVPYVRAIL